MIKVPQVSEQPDFPLIPHKELVDRWKLELEGLTKTQFSLYIPEGVVGWSAECKTYATPEPTTMTLCFDRPYVGPAPMANDPAALLYSLWGGEPRQVYSGPMQGRLAVSSYTAEEGVKPSFTTTKGRWLFITAFYPRFKLLSFASTLWKQNDVAEVAETALSVELSKNPELARVLELAYKSGVLEALAKFMQMAGKKK